MLRKLKRAIDRYRLLASGDHVLVAVSGGADSMALLHALHSEAPSLGITLTVAHLDHRIRGRTGEEDAAFVTRFARKRGLDVITGRADVPRAAARKGMSLEMAARDARYRFLVRTARRVNATVIATAHHADDQAETVLLKLARGAGARGLAGIPRKTSVHGYPLVRPLLDVTRHEIIAYLRSRKQAWREDETNGDDTFLRNRVRHQVLPFLETFLNPSIRQALRRTADVLGEEDGVLERAADEALSACLLNRRGRGVDIARLQVRPLALRRRILRSWLVRSGVPAGTITFDLLERIDETARGGSGRRQTPLPGGGRVVIEQGRLAVQRRTAAKDVGRSAPFRQALDIPGETLLPDPGLRIGATVHPGLHRPKPGGAGRYPARASISRAAVGRKRVYVRSWRPGDRMRPLGLAGTKKLQDIFMDEKVLVYCRARIPVFECGGEIVWIPGYRVAQGWEVKDPALPALHLRVDRY